jgi:hypothetical protein
MEFKKVGRKRKKGRRGNMRETPLSCLSTFIAHPSNGYNLVRVWE